MSKIIIETNTKDPVLIEIIKRRCSLENNRLYYKQKYEETTFSTHKKIYKDSEMKILEEENLYYNLLSYCNEQLQFDINNFTKDCNRLFTSSTWAFLRRQKKGIEENLKLKQEIYGSKKRVATLSQKMHPTFLEEADLLIDPGTVPFYSQLFLYVTQLLMNTNYFAAGVATLLGFSTLKKTRDEKIPDYKKSIEIERAYFLELFQSSKEFEQRLIENFEKWAQTQPWLKAYVDIYLVIEYIKIKEYYGNELKETQKQYKKESN